MTENMTMRAIDRIKATAPSFDVTIHMAGDAALAKQAIQNFVDRDGLCVTLSAQTFIYTGGCEEGIRVGLINYPRFPSEPEAIVLKAQKLATHLRVWLGQQSYSIVTPENTLWYSTRSDA